MTMSSFDHAGRMAVDTFRHEALFYDGVDDFVDRIGAFVDEGARAGEAVLVVVTPDKLGPLRHAVGDAKGVTFADMTDLGRNPARIIPAWREFLDEHIAEGRPVRGVGEPIFAARTPDELVECQRHETLLNLAFDGTPAWWLLCPYDVRTLDGSVLDGARRSHPVVSWGDAAEHSHAYDDVSATVFDGALSAPPPAAAALPFDAGALDAVRRFVVDQGYRLGLPDDRVGDLVLAVHELATNSVRHGGGEGVLRIWAADDRVVCEVQDRGWIDRPLAGRLRPDPDDESGRGLWLVNHLCDLVQVRSKPGDTVVRVHLRAGQLG